jgi:hypothetical protein
MKTFLISLALGLTLIVGAAALIGLGYGVMGQPVSIESHGFTIGGSSSVTTTIKGPFSTQTCRTSTDAYLGTSRTVCE